MNSRTLTPLELRQAQAMGLAFNLISAKAIADLIAHDDEMSKAEVKQRARSECASALGLPSDPAMDALLKKQIDGERKNINDLFIAAGNFQEQQGISA